MLLWGCATQSAAVVKAPFSPARYRAVKIEPCQDLTGFAGTRNMKEEGTRILTEKVKAMNLFEISTDAPLVLTCDIESFAEGSAVRRWFGPLAQGDTHATVAVIVWEAPGDKMLALMRSRSSVERGGLYTTGADQYILDVAFNDTMSPIECCMEGSMENEMVT